MESWTHVDYPDVLVIHPSKEVYWHVSRNDLSIHGLIIYHDNSVEHKYKGKPKCDLCNGRLYYYDGIVICKKCNHVVKEYESIS